MGALTCVYGVLTVLSVIAGHPADVVRDPIDACGHMRSRRDSMVSESRFISNVRSINVGEDTEDRQNSMTMIYGDPIICKLDGNSTTGCNTLKNCKFEWTTTNGTHIVISPPRPGTYTICESRKNRHILYSMPKIIVESQRFFRVALDFVKLSDYEGSTTIINFPENDGRIVLVVKNELIFIEGIMPGRLMQRTYVVDLLGKSGTLYKFKLYIETKRPTPQEIENDGFTFIRFQFHQPKPKQEGLNLKSLETFLDFFRCINAYLLLNDTANLRHVNLMEMSNDVILHGYSLNKPNCSITFEQEKYVQRRCSIRPILMTVTNSDGSYENCSLEASSPSISTTELSEFSTQNSTQFHPVRIETELPTQPTSVDISTENQEPQFYSTSTEQPRSASSEILTWSSTIASKSDLTVFVYQGNATTEIPEEQHISNTLAETTPDETDSYIVLERGTIYIVVGTALAISIFIVFVLSFKKYLGL